MLMFSRVLTLSGSPRRAMPWAVGITEYVNAHSSMSATCWLASFGYPVGTVAWSALVESQAALAASTADLLADMVAGPGQDTLRELVYGTPAEPPALGAVATVTTATAIVDRMADSVGWAVEIGQHVESVIETPVAVLTDVFGTLGTITWITSQPDFAAADVARGKLNADGDYLKKVSGSKGLFIEGSGHNGQVTRIA